MKAKAGVVDFLNRILSNELTGINQYFLHAEMCQNWGYSRLYEKLRDLSIDEMKDAERLIEHILFLEGTPSLLARPGAVEGGGSVEEQLRLDLQTEMDAIATMDEAIGHCTRVADYATRALLEGMVQSEETHVDWLETQRGLIEQLGLPQYLSQQIR